MNNTSFYDRIKEERKRLKLTQKRMAELGGVGLRAQQHYEKGTNKPGIEYLESLDKSAEIDFDVGYILSGQRKRDASLLDLPSFERGLEVMDRVLTILGEEKMSFGKEGTHDLCRYAHEHCPTKEGLRQYIKSVWVITQGEQQAGDGNG